MLVFREDAETEADLADLKSCGPCDIKFTILDNVKFNGLKDLPLDKLMVMQEHLRDHKQISQMTEYVKNGGFWTADALDKFSKAQELERTAPICEIASFPNDVWMIHDGHHRIVSIFLGGRNYLRADEYFVKKWDFEKYLEINFSNKWVTPFDPRIEIRIANIKEFKDEALRLSKIDEQKAIEFIQANKQVYAFKRNFSSVAELAKNENLL